MPITDLAALRAAIDERGFRFDVVPNPGPAHSLGWEAAPAAAIRADLQRGRRLITALSKGRLTAELAVGERAGADLAAPRPARFDWRDAGVVGPVTDQERCGSCVSFATVGLLQTMVAIELGRRGVDLSEADQHFNSSHGAICSGWNNADALGQIHARGVVPESLFAYAAAFDSPPKQDPRLEPGEWLAHAHPVADRAHTAYRIGTVTAHQGDDRKAYLATIGPLVCGFTVYEDFDSAQVQYHGGVYRHVTGAVRGGHAVLVVGYDDQQQAWICRNSWGAAWGGPARPDGTGAGFFMIGYGEAGIDDEPMYGGAGVTAPMVVDPVSSAPVLIQSRFGKQGNFEVVVGRASGGLQHFWRANDDAMTWHLGADFGVGHVDSVTMIQSNYGTPGNLEVIARVGTALQFYWRDSGPAFHWNGPFPLADGAAGDPVLIQSRFGKKGNFELIYPAVGGGLTALWRDNDDPAMPWKAPTHIGSGPVDGVTMIQSNYGTPGNLEVIARVGTALQFYWRDSGPAFHWNGPFPLADGAAGDPVLIQSRFGKKGNFELIYPAVGGGLTALWRDNDDPAMPWKAPTHIGSGPVDGVTMIQSNYGTPGNLEVIARVGTALQFYWRDSGPAFQWNGPFHLQ